VGVIGCAALAFTLPLASVTVPDPDADSARSLVPQRVVAVMGYGTPFPRPRSGRGSAATSMKPSAVSSLRIGSGPSRCMNGSSLLVPVV